MADLDKIVTLEPFAYTKLSTPHGIRLIRVKSGTESDPIDCDVFESDIDDAPPYEALSYTWQIDQSWTNDEDPEPPPRPVKCNGQLLEVSRNLYHALAEFRRRQKLTPIWVDRICINQDDPDEKDQQISMMDKIYTSAQKVIVWLGKASAT